MSYNGGHIFAPVSVADVSSVLGEPSLDVATLCTSDKINPYSLIRPLYSNNPRIMPKDLEDTIVGPTPTPLNSSYQYERHKWGYYLPYVGNASDVTKILDIPWFRNKPDEDTYKCLAQFDGYLHDANPTFPISIEAVAGSEIKILFQLGFKDSSIVDDNGTNQGGTVSIPNVYKGTPRYGCSIWSGDSSIVDGSFGSYLGYFVAPETSDEDNVIANYRFNTGITAESNRIYTVVPWIASDDPVNAGAKIYSLKYADSITPYLQEHVPLTNMSISVVVNSHSSSSIVFRISAKNEFSTAQSLYDFKVVAKYRAGTQVKTVTATLTPTGAKSISALTTQTFDMTTTNSEIVGNYSKLTSLIVQCTWSSPTGQKILQSLEMARPSITPPSVTL